MDYLTNYYKNLCEQLQAKLTFLEAEVKKGKKLDSVGKEDEDIDNDGDEDSTDKYLLNRRKAIGKAMASKTLKEESESDKKELARINADRKAEGKPPFKTLHAALTYYEREDERARKRRSH